MNPSVYSAPDNEFFDWKPYVALLAAIAIVLFFFPLKAGSFGTMDFIQYWSAWDLMVHGKNPYDPALLHETQIALTSGAAPLVYSWNPPWTYIVLAPLLELPFTAAANAWLILQVAALLFMATKLPKALKVPSLGPVWGAVAVLAFLPTLYTLRYGQLGVLFALSITCFLLAINNQNFRLAGLSLIPLSAKPHLFLLCAIPGILWLFQIPRASRRDFLVGAVGGGVVLLALTFATSPLSFTWWLASITSDGASASPLITFQNWMAHTTATAIRLLAIATTGHNPLWPLKVVPLISCFATALYFIWRRPTIDWSVTLPPILCLSLATASYGWVFDQTVLILCNYLIFARAFSKGWRSIEWYVLLVAVSVQVTLLVLTVTSLMFFHFFFLLPWLYLGLLTAVPQRERTRGEEPRI